MKTRITLIISLLIFTALSVISISANAQRRTAREEAVKKESRYDKNTGEAQKNSDVKNAETKTKSPVTSPSGRRSSMQKKQPVPAGSITGSENRKSGNSAPHVKKPKEGMPAQPGDRTGTTKRRNPENNRTDVRKTPDRIERESSRGNGSIRNDKTSHSAATPRARTEHNRTIYRIDSKDNRYSPTRNFKGNKSNWSAKVAGKYTHYNKRSESYYRHYDHRKYNHWDHEWENYRWNVNSWRDYYSGYHPYSYQYHKHYFYHPGYGHVIRRFSYKPVYFVHNNIRYYNYNGHFFRHFKGVGYVLTDMPYGLVFHHLPARFETAYINGFLYFRVGNLFFEKHPHGFALIHYPERYFALDDDFYNGGYYRAADYNIYR